MRLTTRGRYAVTALLDLALQNSHGNQAVSLSDIAKRQDISISYLEQLFSKLRKGGLVTSTRGASGGYHLAKPLEQIHVMQIISAVDESVDAMACEGKGDCQGGAMCLTHDLWSSLSSHIENYLSNVTLAQLITMKNVQSIADRQQAVVASKDSANKELASKILESHNNHAKKIDTVEPDTFIKSVVHTHLTSQENIHSMA